jgi:hypothetical protein
MSNLNQNAIADNLYYIIRSASCRSDTETSELSHMLGAGDHVTNSVWSSHMEIAAIAHMMNYLF